MTRLIPPAPEPPDDPQATARVRHWLAVAKDCLDYARRQLPDNHPTATAELAAAHEGIASAQRWVGEEESP